MESSPSREDLGDMCFSEYLLEDSATRGNSNPESDRRRQLTTKVLVIDFDGAEDTKPTPTPEADQKDTTDRTGTLIFMARMVRSVEYYPDGIFDLPAMPVVAKELLEHYPQARIKAFPGNEKERIEIPEDAPLLTPFKHLLRYDAESVFWYLLWCCVQAQPAEKAIEDDIRPAIWSNLTSPPPDDPRHANFIQHFPKRFLHPVYRELEPLLKSMSRHLGGDLEYAEDKGRKTDEYLHEVFQRLILNFLSANWTKDFMLTRKHKNSRGVLGNPMDKPSKSTTVTGKRKEYPGMAASSSDKQRLRKE